MVRSGATIEEVCVGSAVEGVIAVFAIEAVVSGLPIERVFASSTSQGVVAGGAIKDVVVCVAGEGVVVAATSDVLDGHANEVRFCGCAIVANPVKCGGYRERLTRVCGGVDPGIAIHGVRAESAVE